MKKSVLIKTIIASSLLIASVGSYAADGTITFNGQITAASCTVGNGASSTDLNVTMPSVTASSIGTSPDVLSGMTTFSIELTNCKSQTTTAEKMRVTFSGQGDENNPYVLKNTASSGAATNVGIQLLEADAVTRIDINAGSNKASEITLPTSSENPESYVLHFNAAYVNVGGAVPTAGAVTATANYTIEYN
ncbi:fimbrial protein [Vibrio sp. M260112]|uniref:fimbrial protein n=1 Tax=Vibrio sp. M260112 TaxID=3020895 RepID=UPI002F3E96D3